MTWTLAQAVAAQGTTAAGTTVTGTFTGATTIHNLLVAWLVAPSGSSWLLPAGWAQGPDVQNGGVSHSTVAYYLDNPGGITSAVFTFGATANLKVVVGEFHTDVAGAVVSLNARGTGLAGAVAQCAVSTGTAAAAGDLAVCCFLEHFVSGTAVTWTDPSGFTLAGSDGGSGGGNHQYAAYQLSAAAGTLTVTGKTGTATTSGNGWTGAVAAFTATAPSAGTPGYVGAYVPPGPLGVSTQAQAISAWQAITSRALPVRRVYFGPAGAGNAMPSAITTDLQADAAAGRRIAMSLRPPFNPVDSSYLAKIDTFLKSCHDAGLSADVSLWPEPNNSSTTADGAMTAALYKAGFAYYAPTVRQYFGAVHCTSSYFDQHSDPSHNWYPGDNWVDKIATDIYCSEYDGGVRLDTAAAVADGAAPPKPFGVWETNSSTDPVKGQTQAQSTAFFTYLQSYFTARLAAGKTNADVLLFNSNSNLTQETAITSSSDYRVPLYGALFDALSGATGGGGAQTVSGAAVLTAAGTLAAVPSGGGPAPSPAPQPGSRPGYPQIMVELGLTPVADPGTSGELILDDPAQGLLDTDTLAGATVYTDVAAFLRSGSVSRTVTRLAGPLLQYEPGTGSAVFRNPDGRFDPDCTISPYAASGVNQIRSMLPFRVRVLWGGTIYSLFTGYIDAPVTAGTNFGPNYDEITLSGSDAFKVLAGIVLPPQLPQGGGELSGARVTRALNAAGWAASDRLVSAGNSALQATDLSGTVLDQLRLAADSEMGELYVDGAGRVVFRQRHAVMEDARSTRPQAVFGDRPGNVVASGAAAGMTELPYTELGRVSDDVQLVNDWQVTNANTGALQEVTDLPSVSTYLYPRSYGRSDLLLQTDQEAAYYAAFGLHVSSAAGTRFDTVTVDPRRDPVNLFPQVLGREIGDRVQVWRRPPWVTAAVEMYGAPGTFAGMAAATVTASGHSFIARPTGPWRFGAGEALFYTAALPDGQIALSTAPLTSNELQPTYDHAELNVFDPARGLFYRVTVPTSAGATVALNPGTHVGGTDAGGGDLVIHPASGRVMFTCGGYYFGWNIPAVGLYPGIGQLARGGDGNWAYDGADSKTGDQIEASNPTAFSVINSAQTAGNGASYWGLRGIAQMDVFPASRNVIVGHYFNGNGHNSGCVSVVDSSGNLLCAYQIPDMNRQDGATSMIVSPREIKCDPSSATGDERFVIVYDVFGNSNAQPVPSHAIQEFSYNAGTQTVTPKSVPCISGIDDAMPQYCFFSATGTLYVANGGQNTGGNNSLFARNMDVYLKKTGERDLVTLAPATTTWATDGRYATPVKPDFTLGFPVAQNVGIAGPLAVDVATGAVLGPTLAGKLAVTVPSGGTALGANLLAAEESGFEGGTTGGYTGTVTTLTNSTAFAHGGIHSLKLSSGFAQATFVALTPAKTVTPGQEYYGEAWLTLDAGALTATVSVAFNWYSDAAATAQIGSTTAPVKTVSATASGTFYRAYGGAVAAAGAMTGKLVLKAAAGSNVTAGQGYYADDVVFAPQPYRALLAAPDLGITTMRATYPSMSPGRPCVVGRKLWIPWAVTFTAAESAAYSTATYVPDSAHPQFLQSVHIDAAVSGEQGNVMPAIVKDCFIRGVDHQFDASANLWLTTWTLQNADRYALLTLDGATLGVLGGYGLAY